MHRIFDHIDVRVPNVDAARAFYDPLMAAIGFGETDVDGSGLFIYCRRIDGRTEEVVTLVADPQHRPSKTRVAFGAASREEVDRITAIAVAAGATNVEPPAACPEYSPTYYAAFFDDPEGNALEVVFR
jgi:catechol 2,3-dioxygenase-like lactoylglutathione lyase family enzyme